ncbi:RNA polymerase sigma-70 factor, ECF subfamily [Salinimicrobium catena]|uniref:RNA polymerase sigma-70 factor, ECF subfamily n=1 Tax=Salinimicrobium catena TaxID=390640 RepID=A0A1H5JDI2_9FLAO|nr:RNA polymerase sigma factor [Salinimicrobium catena]SDK86838.1 RNA polymerase sigma-70 factor, ECF subfamily [Salinimicrobium catena]SEE50576.1 RNA polymerase sigma-70 factor, ECF subfamily [Salinimicrobium catena]
MPQENLCNDKVFNGFYLKYSRDLYNFMYYKSGDEDQAMDLVQEAFVKIFQNCGKIQIEKAKSYLFTTANNLFLNVVKHQKVKLAYAQQQPAAAGTAEDPQFVLQEKEYMEQLENAIADLTEAQREVFLMNRIDGKKYREIAELLDISEKAVEKRMMGALKKLRSRLDNF